jgi:acyl dehydratase
MTSSTRVVSVNGPFFEDLEPGLVLDDAPAVTLQPGAAALHQAITGGRLRLALDGHLSERVLGHGQWLADPAYVWNVAIGQSTQATQNVIANLFYRGLSFRRTVVLGDTLRTTTEVVGRRPNRDRSDRPATGLVALRIVSRDQNDRIVLDFWRCAMVPRRTTASATTYKADDLDRVGVELEPQVSPYGAVDEWRWEVLRSAPMPKLAQGVHVGARFRMEAGDLVSSAPELARLTTNIAAVHHDERRSPEGRLVYGGHTVAIALAQATRVFPGLLTVIAWESCDHLAPVREGDTLVSVVEVEAIEPGPGDTTRLALRSVVTAAGSGGTPRDVLDWRFVALAN